MEVVASRYAQRIPIERQVQGLGGAPLFGASWDEVSSAIAAHETYLVHTVGSDADPHVVPVLGLWFAERLYFNSSDDARKPGTSPPTAGSL